MNKLPLKEFTQELINLTDEQYREYISKLPLNESNGGVRPIVVEDVEEYLREGGFVNAWDVINKL